MLDWNTLSSEEQLEELIEISSKIPCLIFKHSTRCSLSSMVLSRLERGWKPDEKELKLYFLDLIGYRSISNKVASVFGIMHESPQVLLISAGRCIFTTSHSLISSDLIDRQLNK